MSLALVDRTINTVRLIDDDASVRAGYRYSVEDLNIAAEEITGPITDFQGLISLFDRTHDAVICDFNLKTKNYSARNGDEIVSSLYAMQIPAVLCTRWAGDLPEPVRHRRRQIPVVLSPNDLSSDSLRDAFEVCVNEFSGEFSVLRRPWRTLVRVEGGEELGGGYFRLNVVIPAWNPSIGLTFVVPTLGNDVLSKICAQVTQQDIVRVFGHVNLGAEKEEDIYIDAWSLT